METLRGKRPSLLILGAGPAGCAAAIAARQAGLEVKILERHLVPRRVPGETLHPGIELIFAQLGVMGEIQALRPLRHRGVWRQRVGEAPVFTAYGRDHTGPWLGFQIGRAELHGVLRRGVAQAGGAIESIGRLEAPIVDGGAVAGVRADGREFRATFVFDAAGRHGWLGHALGLVCEKRGLAQRLRFGWAEDDEIGGEPSFVQRPDGWNWSAPIGGGQRAWTQLRYGEESAGIDYGWSIFRECAGPGYFLLGDAACVMDPSTGNGVLRAMMSGQMAVHLVRLVRQEQASAAVAAVEYRRWLSEVFDQTWLATQQPAPISPAVEAR